MNCCASDSTDPKASEPPASVTTTTSKNMASSIQFHAMPPSANCAVIRGFCAYAGIPVEEHNAWGKTRSPEFIAKFPNNAVPAIEHGEVCVTESLAIMRYLTKVFDSAKKCYPFDDPVAASKIDMVSDYTNSHLAMFLPMGVYGYLQFPCQPGMVESIEECKPFAEQARAAANAHILELLETRYAAIFLKETKFLYSDTPTIADFRFAPLLTFIKVGNTLPERIQKYRDDMYELEGFKEAMKDVDGYCAQYWK